MKFLNQIDKLKLLSHILIYYLDSQASSSSTVFGLVSSEEVTPNIISRTYSIPAGTAVTQSNNSQVIYPFTIKK